MKKMVQVIFGGSMALYVDGELAIYRKSFDYNEILTFLLESIHKNFEPIQTIRISDESTFWDTQNVQGNFWIPNNNLETLKEKLDFNVDVIF